MSEIRRGDYIVFYDGGRERTARVRTVDDAYTATVRHHAGWFEWLMRANENLWWAIQDGVSEVGLMLYATYWPLHGERDNESNTDTVKGTQATNDHTTES
jgi:hypothetical protein